MTDRDKTISQLEKTTGDAHTDLRKQIGDLNKVVGDVKAEMSSKNHTNNATKRNADRILEQLPKKEPEYSGTAFEINTAHLFSTCKNPSDHLESPSFFLYGHGPFCLRVTYVKATGEGEKGSEDYVGLHLGLRHGFVTNLHMKATLSVGVSSDSGEEKRSGLGCARNLVEQSDNNITFSRAPQIAAWGFDQMVKASTVKEHKRIFFMVGEVSIHSHFLLLS